MTIERIEELLGLLPSKAPYLARIPRSLSVQGFPREIDIRGHVLNDPSFGWNFIQSSNFELLGRMSRALAMFAMQVNERRSPKLFRIAKDCSNCVVNHTPETSYLDGV